MATALVGFLDSGYSAANTFEGSVGLLYETTRSVTDLAQNGVWRDAFGSGAARTLRGATRDANGFVRDYIAGPTAGARRFIGNAAVVIDVARVGWNLDHGDYGSALSTGAGVAGTLIGRAVPVIGATTFLGQQLIDSQQSSAQEAIDAVDATGAALSQTQDRINMARGLNAVQGWAKEFNAKGCGEFYK